MRLFKDIVKLRFLSQSKSSELKRKDLFQTYRVFAPHYRAHRRLLVIAGLSTLVTIGITVLMPWPIKLILDHVILQQPVPAGYEWLGPLVISDRQLALILLSASMVLLAIMMAMFSFVSKYLTAAVAHRISADVRERVYGHLQRLSLTFHNESHSGGLVYLLTSDIREMKGILVSFPQLIIKDFLTVVIYGILMIVLEWRLALVAMVAIPLIIYITRSFGSGLKLASKQRRKHESDVAAIISENVKAMPWVQAYGQEDSERARFSSQNQESLAARLQGVGLHKTYNRLIDFLIIGAMAALLYYGGYIALSGKLMAGTLVVFVAYTREIYTLLQKFGDTLIKLTNSMVCAERIIDLIANDMVNTDHPSATTATRIKGRIVFENVSFQYKSGVDVLNDISFDIRPGETVALLGHSGAGKSTLVSLLLRFYDPYRGRILLDDFDIRLLTRRSLRNQITVVLQEAKLFRQSVRENILFGKPDASMKEIWKVCEKAQAHEFIESLPHGYETFIEEGGDNLSGGQKQRINIARAMIRNTPIVILDEPATGLDARAEKSVNLALRELTRDKTTFIIAHKFATIANADKILLLDAGRMIAQGTHSQLMRDSNLYRQAIVLQSQGRKPSAQLANLA